MHKLAVSLAMTATILFAGSLVYRAEAAPPRAAAGVSTAAQIMTPIKPAACGGWGPYCRPGWTRVCGPYRCWCRPCW
jgi:hypothetical protein